MTFFIHVLQSGLDNPSLIHQIPGSVLNWENVRKAVVEKIAEGGRLYVNYEWHNHLTVRGSLHFVYRIEYETTTKVITGYACAGLPLVYNPVDEEGSSS
jgi:hypothetical protein